MFDKWKKEFSIEEMIEMENALKNSVLRRLYLNAADTDLLERLKLEIEYVDSMDDENEAELLPAKDGNYLGLIRLRRELEKYRFAYSHEIIHYIFDVGYEKRVERSYTRKRQGKTKSRAEQVTNYLTAAYVMPYEEICEALAIYDNSHPKMDEIKFIGSLRKKYDQSETAVVRRIREVRRLKKSGYC